MIIGDGHIRTHAIRTLGQARKESNSGRYTMVKARVDEVIYPDDERNSTFNSSQKQIEYTCTIVGGVDDGKRLFNVVDGLGGSQFDNEVKVRTATTNLVTKGSNQKSEQSPAVLNGEIVRIVMMYGSGDIPVIVGNMPSPLQGTVPKKADGIFYRREFNGMVFSVDKEGAFSVEFGGGPKDKSGKAANTDGAGTKLTFDKDGNFSVTDKEGQTFKMDRANKTIRFGKTGNEVVLNTSSGAFDLLNKGPGNIKSQGPLQLVSEALATLKGAIAFIQDGGMPAARLGDTAIGTGNHGAPVISTIVTGSGSCLIGG